MVTNIFQWTGKYPLTCSDVITVYLRVCYMYIILFFFHVLLYCAIKTKHCCFSNAKYFYNQLIRLHVVRG